MLSKENLPFEQGIPGLISGNVAVALDLLKVVIVAALVETTTSLLSMLRLAVVHIGAGVAGVVLVALAVRPEA